MFTTYRIPPLPKRPGATIRPLTAGWMRWRQRMAVWFSTSIAKRREGAANTAHGC